MKRILTVALAAVLIGGPAYAHIDFTDRAKDYAAQPQQGQMLVAPVFLQRPAYTVRPTELCKLVVSPRGREIYC